MKLLNKISSYFLISSFLLFMLMFYVIYLLMYEALEYHTDKQLKKIYKNVVKTLKAGKEYTYYHFVIIVELDSIDANDKLHQLNFEDIELIVDDDNNIEAFRELNTIEKINDKYYKIIIRASIVEKELFLRDILIIAFGSYVLLFISLFVVNKKLSKKIFTDFYDTLTKISEFSLTKLKDIQLKNSKIDEFNTLNTTISYLIDKAQREYYSLKQFTEETNHEIQTPIAIIKSRFELLLQSPLLTDSDAENISIILNNIRRIERLSKSLLLLNKLENLSYFENDRVNISEEVEKLVQEYQEIIKQKGINVSINVEKDVWVVGEKSLINILLNNLFSNAVKYNVKNGIVVLIVNKNFILISNSVKDVFLSPENFFEKYYRVKSDKDDAGVGLGLYISKKICDIHNFKICNGYENNQYFIKIEFCG